MKSNEVRNTVRELLEKRSLGVLATQKGETPYATLVAFAFTEDMSRLIFATPEATRKYAALKMNPRCCLLVDNAQNREGDFEKAAAVTALGRAFQAEGQVKTALMETYLKKHPYLSEFVRSPETAIFGLDVEKYILVTRFQNVMELIIKP